MWFFQRKAFKKALPFLIFVIGASFAMKTVTTIRYRLMERRQNFGLSAEAKKVLAKRDLGRSNSNDSPPKVVMKPKLSELASSDEFVRQAIEEVIERVNRPLPELSEDDPEYQRMMEKLKAVTGKKFSLEDEYNKLRQTDISKWENKRVPRPYSERDETEDETEGEKASEATNRKTNEKTS